MTDSQSQIDLMEVPAFIEMGDESLFGILTEPKVQPLGTAVIHLRGGNQGPSSGRNRISTRLCRRLAQDGYHTLRFDYRGVGESSGVVHRFRHDETFEQDLEACFSWLRGRGIDRFVLVGECFGARTALACTKLSGLQALVLLAAPVRDAEKVIGAGTRPLIRHRSLLGYAAHALHPQIIRSLLSRRGRWRYLQAAKAALSAAPLRSGPGLGPGWVSSAFLRQLEAALLDEIRVLFINGTEDPGFHDFVRAKAGPLGELLRGADSTVRLKVLDGRLAAWTDTDVQELTIDIISSWLAERTVKSAPTTPGANLP